MKTSWTAFQSSPLAGVCGCLGAGMATGCPTPRVRYAAARVEELVPQVVGQPGGLKTARGRQ